VSGLARAALCAALLFGCSAAAAQSTCRSRPAPAPSPLPEVHLPGGLRARGRWVISDSANWAAIWSDAAGDSGDASPAPHMDFGRYRVLVVSSGLQPTSGYDVFVQDYRMRGDTLVLSLWVHQPSFPDECERQQLDNCSVSAATSEPTRAYLIPRDVAALLVEERRSYGCHGVTRSARGGRSGAGAHAGG